MVLRKIKRRAAAQRNPQLAGFTPKIQTILSSRGVISPADLNYKLSELLPPSGLKGIQQASEQLYLAIERGDSILIIGDFDADGATSTAVMLKALTALGASNVDFLVPDRFNFGYGLSVKLVEHAASSLKPDLIVTVDNGIANIDGVARASELGIPVIITDHHLVAEKLPEALAIVNPNQPGDEFASKNLAGVGVAFYLMLSLRVHMREQGWFEKQQIEPANLAELLDIVALGTVADVVVLDRNNRILVEQGLKRIRSGLACPGINAILQVAKRDASRCQASDLGFAVGPRLNAAGRLDDMSVGIACLLADTSAQALPIASRLDQLNRSRRKIEQEMLQQAELDINGYLEQGLVEQGLAEQTEARPIAMCLYDASWHQGVIGILASRVKEKINRPVIVFAGAKEADAELSGEQDSPSDFSIKGSARSVKGVHIRDVLALVDSRHPQLIEKFGGHAMAAGLSIKRQDYTVFEKAFNEAVESHLDGALIEDEIVTDAGLMAVELSLAFARQLRSLGPWGQGFPEPLFDDEFKVVHSRVIAGEHLKLKVCKEGVSLDAMFFRCAELSRANAGDKVRLVYRLDVNEFRGNQSAQLIVEQLEIL